MPLNEDQITLIFISDSIVNPKISVSEKILRNEFSKVLLFLIRYDSKNDFKKMNPRAVTILSIF